MKMEHYLSKADVRAAIGFSIRSLERRARAGDGPVATHVEGRVVYRQADVEAWLVSCRR
jgi:hypothetical protein